MSRESDRAHNRRHLPEALAFIDQLRDEFGPDQVTPVYLYQDGWEVGREPRVEVREPTTRGGVRVQRTHGTRRIGPRAQPGRPEYDTTGGDR